MDKKTLKELRSIAKSKGIKRFSPLKKAQLIQRITEWDNMNIEQKMQSNKRVSRRTSRRISRRKSRAKSAVKARVKQLKPCKPYQVRDPITNRCRGKKPTTSKKSRRKSRKKSRRKSRAKSAVKARVKQLKPCKPYQVRDPITNRCRGKKPTTSKKSKSRKSSRVPKRSKSRKSSRVPKRSKSRKSSRVPKRSKSRKSSRVPKRSRSRKSFRIPKRSRSRKRSKIPVRPIDIRSWGDSTSIFGPPVSGPDDSWEDVYPYSAQKKSRYEIDDILSELKVDDKFINKDVNKAFMKCLGLSV